MSRHLIYVPTLRSAEPGLTLAAREAVRLRDTGVAECDVAVVEHRPTIGAGNAEALARLAARHPQVRFFHVTPDVVAGILQVPLHRVAPGRDTHSMLHRALVPSAVSYGAGPNKAAIFAQAMGYDVLHRRDSDIRPPDDPDADLPAVAEAESILRSAGEAVAAAPGSAVGQDLRSVHLVGTTYLGDPPLDRRDLLRAGLSFAVDVQRLKDLEAKAGPDTTAEQFTQQYLLAEGEPGERPRAVLDLGRETEMGISCYAGIWQLMPEMPMRETLGSDYLTKFFLHDAGFPVIRHAVSLRHAYGDERREPTAEQAATYALRDLRGICLSRVRRRHRRFYAPSHAGVRTIDEHAVRGYVDSLVEAWAEEHQQLDAIPAQAAEIYRQAAASSSGAVQERLLATSCAVSSAGRALVTDVEVGIHEFAATARVWPDLLAEVGARRSTFLSRVAPIDVQTYDKSRSEAS